MMMIRMAASLLKIPTKLKRINVLFYFLSRQIYQFLERKISKAKKREIQFANWIINNQDTRQTVVCGQHLLLLPLLLAGWSLLVKEASVIIIIIGTTSTNALGYLQNSFFCELKIFVWLQTNINHGSYSAYWNPSSLFAHKISF